MAEKINYGYQQKVEGSLQQLVPFGIKIDETHFVSLKDFYQNYKQFIDDGNYIVKSNTQPNAPEGGQPARIWLSTDINS